MNNGARGRSAPASAPEKQSDGGDAGPKIRVVPRGAADVPLRVTGWFDEVARQTREHPVRSAALALGAGYVWGGGLFSRLTARVVGTGMRLGLRAVLIPFVTEHLIAFGQEILTPVAEGQTALAGKRSGSSPGHGPKKGHQRHSEKKE